MIKYDFEFFNGYSSNAERKPHDIANEEIIFVEKQLVRSFL